jgi:hypothetical protein
MTFEKAKLLLRKKLAGGPEVGIIWLVGTKLLYDVTPLQDAEGYDKFKIHGRDHAAYWDKLLAAHEVPHGTEYDDYPRGRVMYDTQSRRFSMLLDGCIIKKKALVSKIMADMHLPSANTDVELDSHYRCPRCLRKAATL